MHIEPYEGVGGMVYELEYNYYVDKDRLLVDAEIYNNWILPVGQYLVPFLLIVILNLLIYLEVSVSLFESKN
jgi:hypothetical protein